ncbi:hypothetical protein BGZ98_006170 [Dissophora globulifera]|nr:hypothetical protein BGZ98_006170 [Dissophora globulifera]
MAMPSAGHQRPSMSVFPIQKALEIAMKESRLLAAASSRGGAGPSGTGMSTGTTFVRQLRRARHARGAIITEHGPTPDISLDEEEEEEGQVEEERSRDVYADASTGSVGMALCMIKTTPGSGDQPSPPLTSKVTIQASPVEAVRELLDSYPAPSPYCVDDKNRSPLHFAAASGDLELVEFLLERGVRPDCGRDIAGNMPLHLAIISNRVDVVAALLKAGADMTLASPMTHKTPLDLAESRLSYLLSRAQESVRQPRPSGLDLFNSQIATRTSFQAPPTQSPALLYQIRGIVNLLRPYVVRQQKLQHGERQKDRQKERSWDRADKYMQYNDTEAMGSNSSSGRGLWRVDSHSADDEGEDEEDNDDMDTGDRQAATRRRPAGMDMDGDVELSHGRREARQAGRRMDADQAEEALETLMNGLSLLEASRRQQQQEQEVVSDATDGNLADSELDTRSEQEVDSALPDLLEQVQQVLEAIKLNETS